MKTSDLKDFCTAAAILITCIGLFFVAMVGPLYLAAHGLI